MEEKKRIGIVTMPVRCNYGGALQSYALQYFLRNKGYDPVVIDCRRRASAASTCHQWIERNILYRHFTAFARQYMHRTGRLTDDAALRSAAEKCAAVITGSDQVWRLSMIQGVERHYFLDFVPDTVRRIAYAASFGTDDLEPCDTSLQTDLQRLVKRFYAISVREDEGIEICRRHWNAEACRVLDPTLLAGREAFDPIAQQAPQPQGELFYFFLGNRHAETAHLQQIAAQAGKRAFTVNAGRTLRISKFAFAFYPPVEAWVRAFADAEAVVTDSFHGVCFALLYGKPFYVTGNRSGGTSRIRSLLTMSGTEERYVPAITDCRDYRQLTAPTIDYTEIWQRLANEREKSEQFLLNTLP